MRNPPDLSYTKGGPGSGHFGHAGRPGERGGSALDGESIRQYSGDMANLINRNLRSGNSPNPIEAKIINTLDRAISHSSLSESLKVYRGGEFYKINDGVLVDLRPDFFRAGSSFRDLGFVSTSKDNKQSVNFSGIVAPIEFEITLPAGSKALDMAPFSVRPYEQEVLLPRGLSFKVVDIKKDGEGIEDTWHISLEAQS